MTSIDLEKIWLWINDESRAHEKIEDKTISPEDGVAYDERWLTAVPSEHYFGARELWRSVESERWLKSWSNARSNSSGERNGKTHSDKKIMLV
jgi:hypothetical protein